MQDYVLYDIVFKDGRESQEYGTSVEDVKQFLDRVFPDKEVASIVPTPI